MRDILIIAHFSQMPTELGYGRFNYIAEKLAKSNKVELITSSFSHREKMQRDIKRVKDVGYKYKMIYEPTYKKNICLKRFYSHFIMSRNLKSYLDNRKKPDLIYCAIPSLDVAKVAKDYAKKKKVKFIIDIQDLWPEAFSMVFHVPIISKIIFSSIARKADSIYKAADVIIAVSDTYKRRALQVNSQCKKAVSVYLGTDKNMFDENASILKRSKIDGIIRIVYIGTMGHSYDLMSIIDAIEIVSKMTSKKLQLYAIGDGPLKEKFKMYAKNKINAYFTGYLKYPEMIKKLTLCDIAVNPIAKGSAGSIINKVGDYAMAGIPIVNTQESKEYRSIVEDYCFGFNCENGNVNDIADKLMILIEDDTLRENMGINHRKCAEKIFDRSMTYSAIFNELQK